MRIKNLSRLALVFAIVGIPIFLTPQRAVAQKPNPPNPQEIYDLQTSIRGPLQQRLAAEYPGRFETSVEIFWEPHDGWISQELVDWWTLRIADDDVEGVNRKAAERMLWRISGEGPVFLDTRRRRRKICAVVGASRNLLGSGYGDLIDAHDVIIRVNRAPTDDFSSDVGEKTTHHVMWPRELDEHQYNREAFLLMTPIASNVEDVFDRIVTLAEQELGWDLGRVRIIHPEFIKYVHESWADNQMAYPSTGFIALMMAVHICDEVDVFGFGADASGRWDRYYEEVPEDVSSFHPANLEARVREEMEEKGILKVFRGSRPDPTSNSDTSRQD